MAILLERGHRPGLLQRVARLVPLQGEPLAGWHQLVAKGGELAQRQLQLGNLLLQAAMLFAVVAAIVGQLQQLAQLAQLFGLLLPLLLRLGEAALPLLLLQLVLLLLQPSLFMLPVVSLLLALLQLALQLLQGAQLVIPQGEQLLQLVGILGPILHGGEQGLPLAGHRCQLFVLFEPKAPLLVLLLEQLHLSALLAPALLQRELHFSLLCPLLLDLLQLLHFLPDAGIELLRPLEFGLQGAPFPFGGDLLRQQLLLGQRTLLGLLLELGQLRPQFCDHLLLLLHFQSEAGQLVVIGAGHLGLLGTGKLVALGGRGAVGLQGGIERRLSLGAAQQLGGNAAVEVAQILHQLLLLLLVLEGGGEAYLLAYPLFAGRFIHQCHVAEALGDGGQLLLLLPRPFIGLDGDGGVELGAGHPFEQSGSLVGIRFEKGGKLPLGQDHRAAKLLPGETHQLVDAILQLPLAAGENLP